MKALCLITFLALLFCGCTTNDFRAVDSLREGISQAQAQESIERFGFASREPEVTRPEAGWTEKGQGYFDVAWRAGVVEKKIQKPIHYAEAYPVSHGFLGYGWIYLFYDSDRVLVHYYRLQIN
jgi:hypothetical protein